jgi:hypothetical protein
LMMFHKLRTLWWVYFHSTIFIFIFMYMQPWCHRVVDGADYMSVAFKPTQTSIHWIWRTPKSRGEPTWGFTKV